MNLKRSLVECGVVFEIDKKVRDPLSISRSKTSTIFLAVVQKQVDVSFQFHN